MAPLPYNLIFFSTCPIKCLVFRPLYCHFWVAPYSHCPTNRLNHRGKRCTGLRLLEADADNVEWRGAVPLSEHVMLRGGTRTKVAKDKALELRISFCLEAVLDSVKKIIESSLSREQSSSP